MRSKTVTPFTLPVVLMEGANMFPEALTAPFIVMLLVYVVLTWVADRLDPSMNVFANPAVLLPEPPATNE
jgi:hypothetical protein